VVRWAVNLGRKTYVCAHFGGSIPNTNNLYITCNQSFALSLLPIKHKTSVSIAGNQLRKRPEGRDYLNISVRLIVAE
jgi:hypothetical protein